MQSTVSLARELEPEQPFSSGLRCGVCAVRKDHIRMCSLDNGVTVRASDMRSSGRGFDSPVGPYQAT